MRYQANDTDQPYEDFTSDIKIHTLVCDMYADINGDIINARLESQLQERIYELFIESRYYDKYNSEKKVDKVDLVEMYYYFRNKLVLDNRYTLLQIFTCFAEFFEVNYKTLYNEICVTDKDTLIRELSECVNLKDRINKNKLF